MTGPKVVAGVGCLFLALSMLALLVSVALPTLTSGRTSWDEAMWGIVPGAVCSAVSFLILAAGVAWLVMGRGKK